MYKTIFVLFMLGGRVLAQDAGKLHGRAIVVDSHNDILTACMEKHLSMDKDLRGKTQSDLARFKQGGVDLQFFSIWCDGNKADPFAWANREMDTLYAVAERNHDKLLIVKNPAQLQEAIRLKRVAAMFGVEGGHMIENDVHKLEQLYERGMRYLTLTWNNSNAWATSAMDETNKADSLGKTHKGLTDAGKQIIRRMNELGVMVDVSHVGEQTFRDALAVTTKPVIASHSNAYSLCPVFRNLKDDQIRAIGRNGGVIQLNFYSGFVDSSFKTKERAFVARHRTEIDSLTKTGMQYEYAVTTISDTYSSEVTAARPPMGMLLDHLDYIVQLAGVDHVGLGSDFDGINSSPQQLDDVTSYPLITKALLERGYSKRDVKKIMGGNFLRVLKANQP
ncbi:dipeptidase [Sediminibacterium soli]|uniref:dipeptidase n=1 Tax=Sediminibacterium soli TaxID=2698829 RepID=UPI001379EE00|nr:dipeptidase [Sediminibacterium soli]NCI47542.1 membrane dipeptidase [Sediminibacterium soli]